MPILMNGLDLFSGIGGISKALEDYVKTVAYVEINKYAQAVLLSRMVEGDIDPAPILRDVTRLDGRKLRGKIDLISGGFPCQDISIAGNGKGLAGERSGLFFEIIRLAKEIRPSFVFLENVPAIRTRGLEQVIKAFTEMGYGCRWTCITASSIGAPHKRERWFLLAHSDDPGCGRKDKFHTKEGETFMQEREDTPHKSRCTGTPRDLSNPLCARLERQWEESSGVNESFADTSNESRWSVEPSMGRVAHGVLYRVDRIKCLGNSVVPIQVKTAFERLMGLHDQP